MKDATIAELRNHLSAYLQKVERGDRLLIRRRNTVVAELRRYSPEADIEPAAESLEAKLSALARAGLVKLGTSAWPDWARRPIEGKSAPVLEALLDEREQGR